MKLEKIIRKHGKKYGKFVDVVGGASFGGIIGGCTGVAIDALFSYSGMYDGVDPNTVKIIANAIFIGTTLGLAALSGYGFMRESMEEYKRKNNVKDL